MIIKHVVSEAVSDRCKLKSIQFWTNGIVKFDKLPIEWRTEFLANWDKALDPINYKG